MTPGEIYGGFARNCIARTVDDDNDETVYTVTDENGCATDPEIFREWRYDRQRGHLTAVFDAFKVCTLLLKEALEKAKRDAKVLKTSFLPPVRKGHAVEAIASSQLSCI